MILVIVLILVGGMAYYGGYRSSQTQHTYNLPTSTEVFNLRSECAALGQKALDNNSIGSALSQSQNSYYNPTTNRCFVQLTVQSANLSGDYFSEYLSDGQTGDLLATATKEKGKKNYGVIYGGPTEISNTDNSNDSFNSTSYYIGKVMNDDWKQ